MKVRIKQPKLKYFWTYMEEYDKEKLSSRSIRRCIEGKYVELFKKLSDVPLSLLDVRISYELEYRGRKDSGAKMSDKFLANYQAAQALDIDRFDPTLKTLLKSKIAEDNMAKVTTEKKSKAAKDTLSSFKKVVGKTLGKGISETWCHVFAQNEKCPKNKRMTDEQISEFMKKEFPDRQSKTFDFPQPQRRAYNQGVHIGLKGVKPTKESVRYDEDGNPYQRSSEKETKVTKINPPKKLSLKSKKKEIEETVEGV